MDSDRIGARSTERHRDRSNASVQRWNRQTIRRGLKELDAGQRGKNRYEACGRKRAEVHLPNVLADIESIVSPGCQTDPTFRTTRLYTPLTAKEVHRRLSRDFRYPKAQLPCIRTISSKLNLLEFRPRKVRKCKPVRKIPENSGQRTQWLHRLVQFAEEEQVVVQLAYYPPYHSKYNPIERVWGVLENQWRGQIRAQTRCARPPEDGSSR